MRARRLPRNLQGLLRFAVEVDDGPATGRSASDAFAFNAMLPERRQWLSEAISSLTVDLAKTLRECMATILTALEEGHDTEGQEAVLRAQTQQTPEDALDTMTDLCDDISLACALVKLGGTELLPALLNGARPAALRTGAGRLCAALAQNNPFCQEALLPHIQLLVSRLDAEIEGDAEARRAVLGAISCLVRGHAGALECFCAADGFAALMRCIQAEDERLRTKTAFLLCAIFSDDETRPRGDVLVQLGVPLQLMLLFTAASDLHEQHHEHLLGALRALAENCAEVRSSLTEDAALSIALSDALRRREAHLLSGEMDVEQNLESVEHCRALLQLLSKDGSAGSTSTVDEGTIVR